ncbi:CDP-glycerol glycerophosphotransferase family protein [Kluyvera ascorbata]|uniref:CDP-glycerol glycerophosphotransferase family protein n=1 Tax=Kluyvera ascorbata TaxID=51288 RepID=UPI0034D617BF
MNNKIKHMINYILMVINYCIPKKNNRVFFKSKPDYSGNAKALSEYITENIRTYEVVWSLSAVSIDEYDFKIVRKGTLKELYYYLTSKFIFTTHNEMIGPVSSNQIYISLWHGMPFKKIGYLGEFEYAKMRDYSANRIATSEIMRSIISASFREKANKVYITGQPRNDYLFKPISLKKMGLNIENKKKIIMYAPTFRMNVEDQKYSDGNEITDDNFLRVDDFGMKELDSHLMDNDCHLLLKLHPYEEKYFENINELSSNISIIRSQELIKQNIDVNQLLAVADVLITDYSSMYFDYLILNRPIIFLVPDLNDYRKSRGGFTLEPFDFWTPGEKVKNQASLVSAIDRILKNEDLYLAERRIVNSIINEYSDNKNCERVKDLMKKLG